MEIQGRVLDQADKSDPLNELVVVGARIIDDAGHYVGGWRARVTLTDPLNPELRRKAVDIALGQLVEAVRAHPDGDPEFPPWLLK